MITSHNQSYIESLRTRQTAALKQVLNLNQPINVSLAVEPEWKLLIFDRFAQDIISPLLSVKQLRELGITLHLLLDSQREILPDVPAVYFVSPTEQNVQIICADLKRAMYDSFYLNMTGPIPRPLLEELASSAVAGGTMQHVQKLTDQFLSFISLEDDLFMLSRYTKSSPTSFYAINNPSTTAAQIDALVADIANGLFAVCVALGVVPVIKCPKNNAAERVAEKLDQKIRDNLRDARNNLFVQENIRAGHLSIHRPVLVIADRAIDLSTMMHHTWTYQAMIADILDMELNRVRMKDKNGRPKDYEFSTDDKLWTNYKGSPFPLVAEAIQENLEAYRRDEDEIKRLKDSMGLTDGETTEMVDIFGTAATAKLSTAVGSLPELLEKKRLIDLHTNVATALLDNIKTRKLDVLFETEEKLLTGQEIPIVETLRDCPDKEDIMRLILIAACSRNMSSAEQRELQAFIEERAVISDALHFVRQLRSFANLGGEAELHQGAGTKTVSMFSKLLSHSSRFVMEGVKNLVPKKHNLPLTKMVEQLTTDVKTGVGVVGITGGSSDFDPDQFRLFDPKLLQGSGTNRDVRPTHAAADVIVFVIGGGNYVEYQNVQEWAKARGLQRCTYGCTEMVSPKQFVEQLNTLGAMSRAM
uniref:Sec1 family domain-containing protein 1 n=1 Tax=Globodera pallida TaxID=36090 RepID=A0A183C2X0_GLOPA